MPPAAGAAIVALGYGTTFGLTAVFPLAALALLPRRDVLTPTSGMPITPKKS